MRITSLCRFGMLVLCIGSSAGAGAQSCEASGIPPTELGKRIDNRINVALTSTVESARYEHSGDPSPTEYLRFLVLKVRGDQKDWQLAVRDDSDHLIQLITANDLQGDNALWTLRVPGRAAKF